MVNKRSLIHQAALIQAPFAFPEIRFFFLLAGYASGKTSGLGDALLRAVMYYSGKKDKEGKPPKIGVCGITLTFLKKTFSGSFVQNLSTTKSSYVYDKAHNIIYVAGVELHLTPIANEEDIFGYDWSCAFIDELDELPTHTAVAVVKAINDRCRQNIEGCRSPFITFATTSQGIKGTYQVVENFKRIGVNFMIIRGKTRDNIYLPKEYVDSMYAIYNEKERKCLLEGEFVSIDSGLVYPDYNPSLNRADFDLYQTVKADEIVYIGQDFNCIEGYDCVVTSKGLLQIRDTLVGTRVLTRKGYRKILTKKNNGTKIVVRCGNVWTTLDHMFITPKGDEPRWKISDYYCLKKQSKLKLHYAKTLEVMQKELLSCLTELYGEDTKIRSTLITKVEKEPDGCTEKYTKNISVRYLSEKLFTIKTELLIIVLRISKYLQEKNTSKHTTQGKELNDIGKKVSSKKKGLLATCAVKHLQEISKQQRYAEQNASMLGRENEGIDFTEQYLKLKAESVFGKLDVRMVQLLVNPFRKLVDAVMLSLKEKLSLFTALHALKPVKIFQNGRVLYGVEREVYDIEVEDSHEFFANGILVHNCGFNKAVACIVRGGVLFAVKTYNFPDVRRAPEVFRYDFPESRIKWIPDATSNATLPEFKKELRAHRIEIVYRKSNPLVRDRTFLINKLFFAERLVVCAICGDLDKALIMRQTDKKTGMPMKGQGEEAPDHLNDGLEYAAFYCITWVKDFRDFYKITLARRIAKRIEAGFSKEEDETYNNDMTRGQVIVD